MAELLGKQLRFGVVQPRTHQFHGITFAIADQTHGIPNPAPATIAVAQAVFATGLDVLILAALAALEARAILWMYQMFPQVLVGKQIFRPIAQ